MNPSLSEVLESVQPVIASRYRADLSKLSGRVDVDDLYQTVCLKAHVGHHQCRAESTEELRRWVLTIAENTMRSMAVRERAAKRSVSKTTGDQSLAGVIAPMADPADAVAAAEALRSEYEWAMVAIARLPERRARAIRMKYVDGLSHQEIAELMNVTVCAARTLVTRGLAAVRKEAQTSTGMDSTHANAK